MRISSFVWEQGQELTEGDVWRRERDVGLSVRIWKSMKKEVSNSQSVSLRRDHETKPDRKGVVRLTAEKTGLDSVVAS